MVIGNSKGVGGSERPKFLKKSMKLNWNFQRGGGAQSQKNIHGGCGYFLKQYNFGLVHVCFAA